MKEKIKVLVVDDSALVRKIITDVLASDPEIEVIGTANNGKTAVFKSHSLDPDVITMDIEMPIMNGLDALQEIIENNPKPVIMMSVLTQHGADATFKALELGAVDFIPKPSTMLSMSVDDIKALLVSKVKSVYNSKIKFATRPKKTDEEFKKDLTGSLKHKKTIEPVSYNILPELPVGAVSDKIVGIGTSTGGPSALFNVFRTLPKNFSAPILVVQHMPEGFTKAFADRLNQNSFLNVKEAEDGDIVTPGHGYVAPGHSHMEIKKQSGKNILRVFNGEKVSGHRPSIDVMFNSLADNFSKNLVAVIMTGMGKDGAEGIKRIRSVGGYTIAQDEETSVVYGMNRVAVEIGGIIEKAPIFEISKKIVEHL